MNDDDQLAAPDNFDSSYASRAVTASVEYHLSLALDVVRAIEKSTVNWRQSQVVPISDLGLGTSPHVTKDEWVTLFSKYTDGIYTGKDVIRHFDHSTSIIKKLFEQKYVGKVGLQYMVAWSIYRQLAEFTEPYLFRGDKKAEESCFVHVKNVMNLAILSYHFQSLATSSIITDVRRMAFRIQSAFWKALNSSSWLTDSIREHLMNQLLRIKVQAGSPGNRLDARFVEKFYGPLPNVPLNRLFPSWIEGRRLNTHYRWKDQRNRLFDEEEVNAYYMWDNTIVIPAGIIQHPFYYEYGPAAQDYGGLGTVIGHELMHGFDVAHLGHEFWNEEGVAKEYIKRTLCLRSSHRSVLSLSGQHDVLDDDVDSENLGDLVGARLAYAAYASLPKVVKKDKTSRLLQLQRSNFSSLASAPIGVPGMKN
ncbi:hypothetical protein MTO96_032205 [Rhipicephalus appendiculatus]